MIIDSHTHVGIFGENKGKNAEELIKSMDINNIDISLIISGNFGNQQKGLTISQLVSISKTFSRLKVVGNIDYSKIGNKQISSLKNLIKKKSVVGIKCYCGYEHYYPNDKKLHSFYRFCSKNGIPIIYHSGFLLSDSSGLLKYSHPLNIDEVATMFPELKIVIAHMGNPWIADCAAVVAKNRNVYVDLAGQFTEFKNISEKEEADFIENFNLFRELSGTCRCIFGTDWWFYSQKEYLRIFKKIPMTNKERDLILWKNAKKIFNL